MGRWFDYLSSDFDERAHQGQIKLDLQDIALPDASLDVILSSHVLEHVPDTGTALRELHRVLVEGGHLYLQIPLLQAETAPPVTPEFHGDDTPVLWRFGWDLLDLLDDAGFAATPLVAPGFSASAGEVGSTRGEFNVGEIVDNAPHDALVELGGPKVAEQSGWRPAYMFVTFEAVKTKR